MTTWLLWFTLAAGAAPTPLADAMAAGDCAAVLTGTSADAVGPWRVPRGLCQLAAGDAAAAEATLAVPLEGVVGEYGRLGLAQARTALGDPAGVEAALVGLSLPGAAGREIRMMRARLAASKGDLEAFNAAASGLDLPELAYLRGELVFAAGKREAAWTAWRAAWNAAAREGWDEASLKRVLETGGPPTGLDAVQRLAALRDQGRIDEAAALADRLTGRTTGAASQGADAVLDLKVASPPAFELARTYQQARRYPESLEAWARVTGPPATARGSATALFEHALTHARSGDYATAAVVYRAVMAQHPTDKQAVFASYKLGYKNNDARDSPTAVPLFEAHAEAHPTSKHLDEARWFTARCAWRQGDLDAAVAAWSALISERPDSSLVPGAVYWTARARGAQGDEAAETAGFERVLSSWPVSGYAWLAADHLDRAFPARPVATRPPWPSQLAERPEVKRSEALLAVGLRDAARDELVGIKAHLDNPEDKLAAAWAFVAVGNFRQATETAKGACASPWKGGDPVAQQVCTPRPEASIVGAVAARFGLNPLLPYAIMTAESNLDPSVTSPAGARGLMQLMPAEGPRIHAELYPDRPYHPDDLYSAPYNASMGTAELGLKLGSLGDLLDGDDLPAVIASYNGGEAAVRRWVEAAGARPEPDAFIEDIGYTETRMYVKRVLGFLMAYRWVYGDPVATPP